MKVKGWLFYCLEGSEVSWRFFEARKKRVKHILKHTHLVQGTHCRIILEAFFKGVVYRTSTKILAAVMQGSWR